MTAPAPIQNQEPEIDFFLGVSFSVAQIIADLNTLSGKVKSLKHSHSIKSASAMKIDAEGIAKLAGQMRALSDHLAGICVQYVNRRGRHD